MDMTGTDTGRWATRMSQKTAHLNSEKFKKQQISPSNTALLQLLNTNGTMNKK
jgi:hypothetical protein